MTVGNHKEFIKFPTYKENETHINELLLLLLRHFSQAVVTSSQVSLQASQGRHRHPFHLTTLSPRTGRGEAQPADTAASPDTGRQNVILIKHAVGYLEVNTGEKEKQQHCFTHVGMPDGWRHVAVTGHDGMNTLEASRSVGCVMVLGS